MGGRGDDRFMPGDSINTDIQERAYQQAEQEYNA